MGPHDRDQFDDLLDAALRPYTQVEPRTGLEGRVLARLAVVEQQSRLGARLTWRLSLASSVGVAILVLFLIRLPQPRRQPVAVHPPSAAVQNGSRNATTAAHKPRRSLARRTIPTELANVVRRPNEFPSPHPLTEQERLLKAYVNNWPQEAALVAREQADREKELAAMGWKSSESVESN